MLFSSIFNAFICFSSALAVDTVDPRLTYTGISLHGFPFPYICDELTPKFQGTFTDLSIDEKKKWVKAFFIVADTIIYRTGDETDKLSKDHAACLGFPTKEDRLALREAYWDLINQEELIDISAERLADGERAREAIQKWRVENGLPLLEEEYKPLAKAPADEEGIIYDA